MKDCRIRKARPEIKEVGRVPIRDAFIVCATRILNVLFSLLFSLEISFHPES